MTTTFRLHAHHGAALLVLLAFARRHVQQRASLEWRCCHRVPLRCDVARCGLALARCRGVIAPHVVVWGCSASPSTLPAQRCLLPPRLATPCQRVRGQEWMAMVSRHAQHRLCPRECHCLHSTRLCGQGRQSLLHLTRRRASTVFEAPHPCHGHNPGPPGAMGRRCMMKHKGVVRVAALQAMVMVVVVVVVRWMVRAGHNSPSTMWWCLRLPRCSWLACLVWHHCGHRHPRPVRVARRVRVTKRGPVVALPRTHHAWTLHRLEKSCLLG